jgi:hypothetical protein
MKVLRSEAGDFAPIHLEVMSQTSALPRLPSRNYGCQRFATLTHQVALRPVYIRASRWPPR